MPRQAFAIGRSIAVRYADGVALLCRWAWGAVPVAGAGGGSARRIGAASMTMCFVTYVTCEHADVYLKDTLAGAYEKIERVHTERRSAVYISALAQLPQIAATRDDDKRHNSRCHQTLYCGPTRYRRLPGGGLPCNISSYA